jgi:hypothetical protein
VETSRTAKTQRTQWTAQFLAAAELVRSGYVVTFTMGNTPIADLTVGRPDGTSLFWVDVKGLGSNNAWLIRRRAALETIFYVLVRVGALRVDDQFFVLSHQQVNDLLDQQRRRDESRGVRPVDGFLWTAPAPFKDNWRILPGWPGSQ